MTVTSYYATFRAELNAVVALWFAEQERLEDAA